MGAAGAVVGREDGGAAGLRRGGHAADGLRIEVGAVAQHDQRPVGLVGQRREPGMQRRRLAGIPAIADHGLGPVKVDPLEDRPRPCAQHDHAVLRAGRGDDREHVFEHRPAVHRVQLLQPSVAPALAGGEHDGCDHTSCTSASAIWSRRIAERV